MSTAITDCETHVHVSQEHSLTRDWKALMEVSYEWKLIEGDQFWTGASNRGWTWFVAGWMNQ